MGNIFKTLGLDDLARSVPVVGKFLGDTLAGLPMGQKSGPGAGKDSFLDGMMGGAGGVGPNPGRMSNEDYQHNQNLLDSSNPREINRTGSFLEGVAPSQGKAWNTYQDATYGEDTQRSIDRTKATGEQLGMSPWEVMGLQGATPLSPGAPTQPKASGEGFLGQMTPLAVAKMNNKTALQQTKIQSDTALKQTEMQTNTQRDVNDQSTAGGRLPMKQVENLAQSIEESIARTGLANVQRDGALQQQIINLVKTVYEILPKEQMSGTLDVPGFKGQISNSTTKGFEGLLRALKLSPTAMTGLLKGDADALKKMLSTMPADQLKSLRTAIATIAKGVGDGANTAMGFLGGMTK